MKACLRGRTDLCVVANIVLSAGMHPLTSPMPGYYPGLDSMTQQFMSSSASMFGSHSGGPPLNLSHHPIPGTGQFS